MVNKNKMNIKGIFYINILLLQALIFSPNCKAQDASFIVLTFSDNFNDTVSFSVNENLLFENQLLKTIPNSGVTPMRLIFTKVNEENYFVSNLVSQASYKIKSWIRLEEYDITFEIKVSSKKYIFTRNLSLGNYFDIELNTGNNKVVLSQQDRMFDYD
jgi:hypothetical protein